MNLALLIIGVFALVLAAIDGYHVVTGKRLFNPPPVPPAEGEEPKPERKPEQRKRFSTISTVLLGVVGVTCVVLAFL